MKLTLLIGLLTYSLVGWSESLIMECFFVLPSKKIGNSTLPEIRKSIGFYKMETDESSSSPTLLSMRKRGQWKPMCTVGCTKGDRSVTTTDGRNEFIVDFLTKSYFSSSPEKSSEGLCRELKNHS